MTKRSKLTTEQWRQAAHETILELARKNEYVVSDMLIAALEEAGNTPEKYSVLGGVFTRAAKAGLIVNTGERKSSTERRKSHSVKTVWRSMIYRQPGATKEENIMNRLIVAALDYNATIIAQATVAASLGQMDDAGRRRVVDQFNATATNYGARLSAILEDFERDESSGGKDGR